MKNKIFLALLLSLSLLNAKNFSDDVRELTTKSTEKISKFFNSFFEPTPLKGNEYKRVYKEYGNARENDGWDDHNFAYAVQIEQKYCQKGLDLACADLAGDLALGLGVKRDSDKAIKYATYAYENAIYPGFKIYHYQILQFIKNVKNYDGDSAIRYINRNFWDEKSNCDDEIKDSCFRAYVLLNFMAADMYGLSVSKRDELWEYLAEKDIDINGRSGSKLYQLISDFVELEN